MTENALQHMIRMAYMTFGWRILYARDVELQVSHGRMTRNTLSPEFFEAWKQRMWKEVQSDVPKLETLGFRQAKQFEDMVRQTLDETNWIRFAGKIENVWNWLKTLYRSYGDKPNPEGGPRVVNRFTIPNRMGWDAKQWDTYLKIADPIFKRLHAGFKKQGEVSALLTDAQKLLDIFRTKTGALAYPGLDRKFQSVVEQLQLIQASGAQNLNKQQSIILSNLYQKQIYPRLFMMWQFARQGKL